MGWINDIKARVMADTEDQVLASGRAYAYETLTDQIRITGPGVAIVITPLEVLWSGSRGRVHRLQFSGMTSAREVAQFHRYALDLDHERAEFFQPVPAHQFLWHRWGGVKIEPRSRTRTVFAFSHRETAAAEALRRELTRHGVEWLEPREIESPSRAERTKDSHAVLVAVPKRKHTR